jgi:ABC-type lipoprotein export system ATPase subunit
MIATTNLGYAYPGGAMITFPDMAVERGQKLLVLGQSGCGKTTLLHLLGGLLTPSQGAISIDEVPLHQLSGRRLDQFRGQHIGIVFQKTHFVRALTVEENLLLAQQLAGMPTDPKRVHSLLERLQVGHKLRALPDRLSQGEQQRVAIARALLNKPALILADEPTSALDDVNTEQVIGLLEEQAREEDATLVVVTHDGRLKSHFPNQLALSPVHA